MVTVILPGYSVHNKSWLEDTARQLRGAGEIRPIYWKHWSDPDAGFEADKKANLLESISGKLQVDIIAKSIGTLVASNLILKSPEKIRKVIFCGIPINDIGEDEKSTIKNALKMVPASNILIFQNDEDPHGGSESVKNLLSEFGEDIKLIVMSRDDHEYFYQSDFNDFILN